MTECNQTRQEVLRIFLARARRYGMLLLALSLSACSDWLPHVDLAPSYEPPQYVVPASWHGETPFVEAKPSDGEMRQDWWKLYDDALLNSLIEQAMAANPDLQAAAERFVQARDVMMQVRSQRIPQVGLGGKAADSRNHIDPLRIPGDLALTGPVGVGAGLASWEPDFWSAIRNRTLVRPTAPKSERPTGGSLASAYRRKLQRTISRCAVTTPRARSTNNRSTSIGIRSRL